MKPRLLKHFVVRLWLQFGVVLTGSAVLFIAAATWTEYSEKHTFPFAVLCVFIMAFVHISAFLLMKKTLLKVQLLEDEVNQLRTPKLSITCGTMPPYDAITREYNTECRVLRLCVKNRSGVKISKVQVQIESCLPGSFAVVLKKSLSPQSIEPIIIGPYQDHFFDFIIADLESKQSRIMYRVNNVRGSDGVLDRQEREIVISATCEESAPVLSRFRLEPGQDGFFTLRAIE